MSKKSSIPRLTRMSMYGTRVQRYTLSAPHLGYHKVPENLTSHMALYKVIGKNLFVATNTARVNLDWTLAQLAELMKKHGTKATLKEVAAKTQQVKQWVMATEAQRADYTKRKARLDAYIVKTAQDAATRHHDWVCSQCNKHLAFMVKEGVLSNEAWALAKSSIVDYGRGGPKAPASNSDTISG